MFVPPRNTLPEPLGKLIVPGSAAAQPPTALRAFDATSPTTSIRRRLPGRNCGMLAFTATMLPPAPDSVAGQGTIARPASPMTGAPSIPMPAAAPLSVVCTPSCSSVRSQVTSIAEAAVTMALFQSTSCTRTMGEPEPRPARSGQMISRMFPCASVPGAAAGAETEGGRRGQKRRDDLGVGQVHVGILPERDGARRAGLYWPGERPERRDRKSPLVWRREPVWVSISMHSTVDSRYHA